MKYLTGDSKELGRCSLALLVAVVLLLSGCSGGASEEERFASATISYKNSDYSKAVIELKNLLQANATHQKGRILLAKSYLAIGDGVSAEKEINRVESSTEIKPEIDEILILSWELQGKYKQIIEVYEKGTLSNSSSPLVRAKAANSYINIGKPAQADELAQELLSKDQNNVAALILRAKAASMQSNDEVAIEYLNKALALDSENPNVWRTLGTIQSKLQEYDQAIDSLKRAVSLSYSGDSKLERLQTKAALVQLLIQKSRFKESEQYLQELKRDFKSNPIVGYLSGLLNYINKRYGEAKTELTEVHRVLPNHMPATLLLGATHFAENNLEQANVLLTRYVSLVPTHLQARKLLGEVKLRLNKPQEALKLLKSTKEQQRDSELLSMIGTAASQSGDYLQGVEYLKKAAEHNPENTQIREELAKLYLSHGAVDEAIAELEQGAGSRTTNLLILSYKLSEQVLSAEQDHTAADYYLRAIIELVSGNRSEARGYLNKAVKVEAGYSPALIALGRMDLEDGRLSEGRDRLNLVLKKEPQNTNVMLLLAQMSERSGQQKQALEWLEKAAMLDHGSILPKVILARYYLRVKQPDKAAIYLQDNALRNSDDLAILPLIAEMDLQLGQEEEAESLIKRIISLNPKNIDAYLQLADLQRKRRDYSAARKTLAKSAPLSYKGKMLLFSVELEDERFKKAESIAKQLMGEEKTKYTGAMLLADVAIAKGDQQTAISLLKKHTTPEAPFYLISKLADLYVLNGDVESSISLLSNRVDASSGKDNHAKLALAMVYQSSNKPSDALALYKDLLSDDPNNVIALNNSALLLFESDPDMALDFAQKAYKRVGDSSLAVTDTYAWLTYQAGDTKSALELIRPILDRTSDPSIHYHYAEMMAASGKRGEARDILKKVFNENRQFQESGAAKQLLSELSSASD
ncbi:MAG: PEP-CTERM system TPR-repeat protein PrsT [Candidatus Thiodiazotropha sp.]